MYIIEKGFKLNFKTIGEKYSSENEIWAPVENRYVDPSSKFNKYKSVNYNFQ